MGRASCASGTLFFSNMYLYVSFMMQEAYYASGPAGLVKVRLEEASGERCLIVPYREMSMRVIRELKPRAVAMSGFGGHFQDHKIEWFFGVDEVFHQVEIPLICFCGSHQLMGFCLHADIHRKKKLCDLPMRKLRPDEHWPRAAGGDLAAYFIAEGFLPTRRVRADPLFTGLPRTMIMKCAHYCEVKKLPPDFVLLASSDHCRIEAMRHRHKPVYGIQFHPEAYAAPFLHGKKVLANFARIVDRYWQAR